MGSFPGRYITYIKTLHLPFSKQNGLLSQGVLLELIFDGVTRSQHHLEFHQATWRETVPKAKRWSFTSPALHLLTVSLKMAGQEVGGGSWKKRKITAVWSIF